MKQSKLMKERIRRVLVLFAELGYQIVETDNQEESYAAGFQNDEGYQGGYYIDQDSRFLEIAYSFTFSKEMAGFVRKRFEEMMKIAYEYGCYMSLQAEGGDITFTLYSKVYYGGLNYSSLKSNLRDFNYAVLELKDLVQITPHRGGKGGDLHGNP